MTSFKGIIMKKRSITYCQYSVIRNKLDIKDTAAFKSLLLYIRDNKDECFYDFKDNDKVVAVESIEFRDDDFIWITFRTGRYGHTAPLINREDGSERNHDKTTDEGEKELTHLCLKIKEEYIIGSIENNKYGITASMITTFFNNYLKQRDSNISIRLSYLSMKGMSDILSKAQRISSIELECKYKKIDDDIFQNIYGDGIKETFSVKLTPEKKRTFCKDPVMKMYDSVGPEQKISRMKIAIRTEDGDDMLLDTLLDKVKDQITVEVDPNGVVVSSRIFPELQDHLLRFEE